MGVQVCVSSEMIWFPALIGQKQGSLRHFRAQSKRFTADSPRFMLHGEPEYPGNAIKAFIPLIRFMQSASCYKVATYVICMKWWQLTLDKREFDKYLGQTRFFLKSPDKGDLGG